MMEFGCLCRHPPDRTRTGLFCDGRPRPDLITIQCIWPDKNLQELCFGAVDREPSRYPRLAAGAKVVKGIPPMAELLHSDDPTVGGKPVSLFVAGDDEGAKVHVAELLAALPAEVTDAGDLSAARLIEPAMMLLVRLAYGLGHGTRVNLRFEQE